MLLNSIIHARLENPASSPATFSAIFQASGALYHRDNGFRRHSAARDRLGRVCSGVCDGADWASRYRTGAGFCGTGYRYHEFDARE